MTLRPDPSVPAFRAHQVYDLEWHPETYQIRLCGLDDGVTYRGFRTVRNLLLAMFVPEHKDTWFYAHAGGLADMSFVLEELQTWETRPKVTAVFSGSSAIVVTVTYQGVSYTLIDSYWLLRDKLAHLARFLHLEKGRGAYRCASYPDCGHVGRACASAPECGCSPLPEPLCMFTAPLPILRDYNALDCRILWLAIAQFQARLLSLGTTLERTIASCGLRYFLRKYLQKPVATVPAHNDWARSGYIASRVEPFRRHSQGGNYYDINSSFPYAMTKSCPGEWLRLSRQLPDRESELYLAEATVTVPPMFLPPLGYRSKSGRIFFPTGTWTGVFGRPDLELLLEAGGRIEKVGVVRVYAPFSDLAAYATELFDERKKETDPFMRIVYKYLLNACYGKFAETREKREILFHAFSERCPHGGKHDNFDARGQMSASCVEVLAPGILIVTEEKSIAHEHVPIALQITSEARRTLYRYLAPCGEALDNCDTDSILTQHVLPTGGGLGELKLEKTYAKGEFVAPKLYRLTDADGKATLRSKGFSALTDAQFDDLVLGKSVWITRMKRIREALADGKIVPGKKTFEKRLRLHKLQSKRRMTRESSEPWDVKEIES